MPYVHRSVEREVVGAYTHFVTGEGMKVAVCCSLAFQSTCDAHNTTVGWIYCLIICETKEAFVVSLYTRLKPTAFITTRGGEAFRPNGKAPRPTAHRRSCSSRLLRRQKSRFDALSLRVSSMETSITEGRYINAADTMPRAQYAAYARILKQDYYFQHQQILYIYIYIMTKWYIYICHYVIYILIHVLYIYVWSMCIGPTYEFIYSRPYLSIQIMPIGEPLGPTMLVNSLYYIFYL